MTNTITISRELLSKLVDAAHDALRRKEWEVYGHAPETEDPDLFVQYATLVAAITAARTLLTRLDS